MDLEVFMKVEENGETKSRKDMIIGNKKKNKMNEWLMMRGWMLVLVLGITVIGFANGQTVPECSEPLYPCLDFMNSTKPPQTCCDPIKEINATQKSCFCQIALTPGILQVLGINASQAIQLLQLCGVNFKITTCKASFSSAPPPSLVPPPPAMVRGDGGTNRATFSGLSFALFFCVYVVFN